MPVNRLALTAPDGTERVLGFHEAAVTVGRAPDNHVHIDAPAASKSHGRLRISGAEIIYEDLGSTNGSIVLRGKDEIRVGNGQPTHAVRLQPGDVVYIAGHALRMLDADEDAVESDGPITVMASRDDLQLGAAPDHVVGEDPAIARRFLRFVRETQITDESALMSRIASFVFEAFPHATHQTIVIRDRDGRLSPVLTRQRDGHADTVRPSATVIERVMRDGVAILFSRGGTELGHAESVQEQGIETAIAAPLASSAGTAGAIQLDVRAGGHGSFTSKDLDLLAAVAAHVALVLDNLRLHREQRWALQSTINALVHSLSWKDPDTVDHSKRVRDISLVVGRDFGLDEQALDVLAMAATLHDMGKHGVRDEILFKPGSLTEEEYEEVSRHAEYTQEILDEIFYPEHLREVPKIAAWHHERMDGEGIYKIPGDELPLQARIIGACDAFDAILSDRPYQGGRSLDEVLGILEEGAGSHWDADVVAALRRLAPTILALCYDKPREESAARRSFRLATGQKVATGDAPAAGATETPPSDAGDDASSDDASGDDGDAPSKAAA